MSAYDSAAATVQALSRPPTNSCERRNVRERTRHHGRLKTFLRDLRAAFDEADEEKLGSLSEQQWKKSALRFYLKDGGIPLDEFSQYFIKIDANCDGRVSWEELVNFMLLEISNARSVQQSEEAVSLSKIPQSPSVIQNRHKTAICQIVQSYWTDEYITVSRDSLRFWQPNPFQFKRKMTDETTGFACVCVFKSVQVMAVAYTNRTIRLYTMYELSRLPVYVSGSYSPTTIKTMRRKDAITAVKKFKEGKQDMPLFNIPTCMIEATLTDCGHGQCLILVGDDNGCVEMFRFTIPHRRSGAERPAERMARCDVHRAEITQLRAIEELRFYASASVDGTVKFFLYGDNEFEVIRVFREDHAITSFDYCPDQRSLIICSTGKDPYSWSVQPVKRGHRLFGNPDPGVLCCNYKSAHGDRYIMTVTNHKDFRLYDSSNFMVRLDFSDSVSYLPEDKFSVIHFDSLRRLFVSCSSYPVIWGEGEVALPRDAQGPQTIGLYYQKDLEQILTVDSNGRFSIWDYMTGTMKQTRNSVGLKDEIAAACVDKLGRRVLTATYSGDVAVWNPYSGGTIANVPVKDKNQISVIRHFTLDGKGILILAGWAKTVSMYREIGPSQFELVRAMTGHGDDICCACLHESGWLITGSVNGELFAWPVSAHTTPRRGCVEDETPIEKMCVIGHFLLVADSDGALSIFTIPGLDQVMRFRAHTELVPYSLSAIQADEDSLRVLTGDTLGYVRLWLMNMSVGVSIEPMTIQRCHDGEVYQIEMIGKGGKYFATAGDDMTVRLWATDSMDFIGTFDGKSTWNIRDIGTWKKETPVESEPQHFGKKETDSAREGTPGSQRLKRVKSAKSMGSISLASAAMMLQSTRSINLMDQMPEDLSDSEKEFDFEKTQEMLDNMLNSPLPPRIPIQPSDSLSDLRPMETFRETGSLTMRSEADSQYMVSKIRQLQEHQPSTMEHFYPDTRKRQTFLE